MGFPPFSKEKLERGTGLALRALSNWCWSQDPTLDFHLVSSPSVHNRKPLNFHRGGEPEVLTLGLLEKEVTGAGEY